MGMNLGIAGSGKIVSTFLEALKDRPEVVYSAICGREHSREKLETLASQYHMNTYYLDYEEMLADGAIDTIYVALPNNMHFEYSLKALQAGKNVICEKPFTSTARELEKLIATAKEQGKFLFEAIITMYLPNYLALQRDVQKIGTVKLVQLDFSQYSSRYNAFLSGETPIAFDPAYSGGALMDLNIYNIHFMLGLFGKPMESRYYPNTDRGIDTSGTLIMQYGGFHAAAAAAKDSSAAPVVKIQGTKGTITVHSTSSTCKNYTLSYNDGSPAEDVNHHMAGVHGMVPEFLSFEKMVREKDHGSCQKMLQHSLRVMEVCEAARTGAGIYFPADKQ